MAATKPTPSRNGMTLAIIGCGTMGTAISSGILRSCARSRDAGEVPRIGRIVACVDSKESVEKLESRFVTYKKNLTVLQKSNVLAMEEADIILLAFKPHIAEKVLTAPGVRQALEGKLLISVLVGSPIEKLQSLIWGQSQPSRWGCYMVRAMCNIAAEFGESMTVIETADIPEDLLGLTTWFFSQLGKTAPVTPDLFDIGGVLGGASGVFLSVALDGILDGAVSQGLKRAQARTMMTQSLISLAKLLEQGSTPDQLREKFSSPKGTTITGLLSLEEDRVRHAFSKAIIASTKRSQDM